MAPETPLASVVVMTFNRPEPLKRCLESLVAQTLAVDCFEVILVDASTPSVQSLLQPFQGRLRLHHHPVPNRGVAANRNAGADLALGRVLAFLDDDCVASPNWLAELLRVVQPDSTLLAAAPTVHPEPTNATSAAGQLISEIVDGFFNPPGDSPRFVPGLNFALHRDRYRSLGGCDVGFGFLAAEDRDFIDRWLQSGGRLMVMATSSVRHDHRTTLRGFVRQYFNYGRGAWRYHRLRSLRQHGRLQDDASLHLQLPIRSIRHIRAVPLRRQLPILLLLLIWEASNLTGFLWQAWLESKPRPWL